MKSDYKELNRWDTIIGRWFSKRNSEDYLVYAPTDMTAEEIEKINLEDGLGKIERDKEGRIACQLTQIGFKSDASKIKVLFEIEPYCRLASIRKKKFCFVFDPINVFCYLPGVFKEKNEDFDMYVTDLIEEYTGKRTRELEQENGLHLWFEDTHPPIISILAAKLVFYHNPKLWEDGAEYY